MTTIPASTRSITYAPVASAGPFPIPFPLFDGTGADLAVMLDDEPVAGWTFTGDLDNGFYGAPSTWVNGRITFSAPISGSLVIEGDRDPRRTLQYAEGRGVPARDHNFEYNVLTALAQELKRGVSDLWARSLHVKRGQTAPVIDLPAFSGKLIGIDGTGQAIPVAPNLLPNAIVRTSIIDSGQAGRDLLGLGLKADVLTYLGRGAANGLASLGADGIVPEAQLPAALRGLAISPLAFGATGDGVADDGPATRLAADAARLAGLPLLFNAGKTFRLATASGTVVEGYAVIVDCTDVDVIIDGTVTCPFVADDSFIFYAAGSIGPDVLLNANISAGNTTLTTTTAHGCAIGDIIKIGSNALFETDTNTKVGELIRVASVSGTTIATRVGFDESYATADAGAVNRMTMRRMRIGGKGLIKGHGRDPSNIFQVGIVGFCIEDPYVGPIAIRDVNTMGVWLRDCWGGRIEPTQIRDIVSTGQGYGVAVDGATQDTLVTGIRFENVAHAVTTSNSGGIRGVQRRITFADLTAYGSSMRGAAFDQPSDAFDTHAGAKDITFRNCVSHWSTGAGFNVECASARVIDCKAISPGNDAIVWTNRTSRAGRIELRGWSASDVRFGRGAYVFKHPSFAVFEQVLIDGVSIIGSQGVALELVGDTAAGRTRQASIRNVEARGTGGSRVVYAEHWDGLVVSGLQLFLAGGAQQGLRLRNIKSGSVTGVFVDMNGGTNDAIYVESSGVSESERISFDDTTIVNGGVGSTGIRLDSNTRTCSIGARDHRGVTNDFVAGAGVSHRQLAYTAI